tara:strand:+ start:15 stop:527 length:513 start_codon:yes stop_codon:yes gene_type:complete
LTIKTIARPYAQAIFEHSEGWRDDLNQVVNAINKANVSNLIDSPKLSYKEKTEIFISLFRGEIQKKTISLLQVLGGAKRLSILPHILEEYQKLLDIKNDQINVLITSAFKLTQAQQDKINNLLKKRYDKNLSITAEVDINLIGGFTIKSGDEVIDLSVKGRLLKLKNQII